MALPSDCIRRMAAAISHWNSVIQQHDDPEYRVLQAFMENAEKEAQLLLVITRSGHNVHENVDRSNDS